MIVSAITVADEAFAVLVAQPAPLAFDARGIAGLPAHHIDLQDLRARLARTTAGAPSLCPQDVDLIWGRLSAQARAWGPAWVVAAVGVALPGLTRITARLSTGHPQLGEDIASEVVAGFLHALRTEDLSVPRLWMRLLWSAWRSGERVRHTRETVELPLDLTTGSSTPHAPYGHPDLLLGRAVALGILTIQEAALIGDTRIGDTLIDALAAEQGVAAGRLRMRRLRAEKTLVLALERGELSRLGTGSSYRRDPQKQARLDGLARPKDRRRGAPSTGQPRQVETPVD